MASSVSVASNNGVGDQNMQIQSFPGLIADLECPVCIETFTAPIYQCIKGHSICAKCKPGCYRCPLCRSKFTDLRNHALEQMLSHITKPCPFQPNGCEVVLKCADVNSQNHPKGCIFRDVVCAEISNVDCRFHKTTVSYNNFIEHLQVVHGSTDNEVFGFSRMEIDYEGWSRPTEWNVSTIQACGRWFLMKLRTVGDNMFIYVMLFGSMEDAEKFKCQVIIGNPDIKYKHRSWNDLNIQSFRVHNPSQLFKDITVRLHKKEFLKYQNGNKREYRSQMTVNIKCNITLKVPQNQ